jgi:hypothetical protein
VSSGSGVTSSSTVLDGNAVPLTTYPFGGEPVVVGPAAANHRTVRLFRWSTGIASATGLPRIPEQCRTCGVKKLGRTP